MAIDKKFMEEVASKIAVYKEGAKEIKESAALYAGFVDIYEGAIGLYQSTLDPKAHNPFGIISLYTNREKLKTTANDLRNNLGNGITNKVGDKEYRISMSDFDDMVQFLNEADTNIGYLYKMYRLQIDDVIDVIGEMKGKYGVKS